MTTENIKATRYVAYLRKSTDDKEKQILSLDKQKDIIERLRVAYSLNIVEYIEEKKSAKKTGRHGFGKLTKLAREKKIDGIVSWSPHRLSRNSIDTGELVALIDEGLIKEIVTENQTFRKTPMDMFMFGFLCAQAKLENDTKGVDVKGGMEKVARIGIYPGCPPLGYLPDQKGVKGARKRDPDGINFPLVRAMWDLMLVGTHTPYQILTKAIDEWGLRTRTGKKPSPSTIYKIFNNHFYYGEFEFPKKSGTWYKATHQPMITKDEFERVQKMINRTTNARPISNYFAYGGCSLHCSNCGGAIVGMAKTKKQKNGNVHNYTYYCCSKRKNFPCEEKSLTEANIQSNVQTVLSDIQIPELLHDFMMDWVREENEKQFAHIYAQDTANRNAYKLALKKVDGLIDMRAFGMITDVQFQERKEEAEAEKSRLMQLVKDTDQNVTTWLDTADKMFTFTELAVKRFQEGSPELQRGILLSLGWNLCIKDKELDLSKERWIAPVKRIAKRLQEELPSLEPVLLLENKDKIKDLLHSPYLCAMRDLNPRPSLCKSAALPTELIAHLECARILLLVVPLAGIGPTSRA